MVHSTLDKVSHPKYYNNILEYFDKLIVDEFTLIPDNPNDGGLIIDPSTELINILIG